MKQQRAEDTRARLVRAAAELFGERGYAGTNISDVTRTAGVTKGALYFHFAAKDELMVAVADEVDRVLEELYTRVSADGDADVQVLIDLTHALGRELAVDPYLRAGFRLAREAGGRGRPFQDSYLSWSAIVSRAVYQVARKEGLASHAARESVVVMVLAMFAGLEALLAAELPIGDSSESLARIWELMLPGMVTEDSARELHPEGGKQVDLLVSREAAEAADGSRAGARTSLGLEVAEPPGGDDAG